MADSDSHGKHAPVEHAPVEHIHFVTGKLAAPALESVVRGIAAERGFDYSISVLNISVAALLTTPWLSARVRPPPVATRILLPGYTSGELAVVQEQTGLPVARGPKDLRELPEFFGQSAVAAEDVGYDIEILAEINHAPRLALADMIRQALALARSGADIIDLGCDPGQTWAGVGQAVNALRDQGLRVSIDSFQPEEVEQAVSAGAECVLSVNSSNRRFAPDWGCPVVAIPDEPRTLAGLDETLAFLDQHRVPFRVDPILEPLTLGLGESIARYAHVRAKYPQAEMLMGIGNVTELLDADSAAVNLLLIGICQELRITQVLTTQVVHWARSSVQECDLARRLVKKAATHGVLAKHLEPRLIPLRGTPPLEQGEAALAQLAAAIKDHNLRIFAEGGQLHVVTRQLHLHGRDPFDLFEELLSRRPETISAGHAFYLGYEMAKAVTALTLDKKYRQDEALDWGFLTQPEVSHRAKPEATTGETANRDAESSVPTDDNGARPEDAA